MTANSEDKPRTRRSINDLRAPLMMLYVFAFCGGMFLIHTRLSGQVNQLGGPYKGVVNGIYIAAYYFGGTIGSWLPAEVYRRAGWDLFLVSVALVLLLAAAGLWAMFRRVGVRV